MTMNRVRSSRLVELMLSKTTSTVFKCAYLLFVCFSFNCLLADTPIVSLGPYAITLFGALIITARLLCFERFRRTPLLLFIALFMLSYLASTLLSVDYGLTGNVKAIIWLSLQFFAVYLTDERLTLQDRNDEMLVVAQVFVAYAFCSAAVSFAMALTGYYYAPGFGDPGYNTGIINGRLWGVYIDPTHGAVIGVMSILLLAWVIGIKKPCGRNKGFAWALFGLNAILQAVFLAYSASRTALVCALVVSAFFTAALVFSNAKGALAKKIIMAGGSAVLTGALCLALTVAVGSTYAGLVVPAREAVQTMLEPNDDAASKEVAESQAGSGAGAASEFEAEPTLEEENPAASASIKDPVDSLVTRTQSADMTAGRTDIWKEALVIVEENPIWGIGHRNILSYMDVNHPDSRIDNWQHSLMHCIFIDVAVSQGVVGLVIFIPLAASAVILALRSLVGRKGRDFSLNLLIVSAAAMVVVSALAHTEIMYVNTVGTVSFWILLGYLAALERDRKLQLETDCGER